MTDEQAFGCKWYLIWASNFAAVDSRNNSSGSEYSSYF